MDSLINQTESNGQQWPNTLKGQMNEIEIRLKVDWLELGIDTQTRGKMSLEELGALTARLAIFSNITCLSYQFKGQSHQIRSAQT
jgi:hypothetical protein